MSQAVGLDIADAASDYIQLYRGDAAALAASLDRIQRAASHILRAINVDRESRGETCAA